MKKIFACAIFIILLIGLAACNVEPEIEAEETTTMIESTAEQMATQPIVLPDPDKPEEIELTPEYYLSQYEYTPTMRHVYCLLPNYVMALCPPGTYDELFGKNDGKEPIEMSVVRLVKHCNITLADFKEAFEKEQESYILRGADVMHEDNELPNPDIVYTFDNEIINAYYRRENPVAPDWILGDDTQKPTYESYSAFLEANPE